VVIAIGGGGGGGFVEEAIVVEEGGGEGWWFWGSDEDVLMGCDGALWPSSRRRNESIMAGTELDDALEVNDVE
jgi:hypothetical protein